MYSIEIKNVSKSYPKDPEIQIVKNISLSIKHGSVFGFIGPNGAGKTSTIKMLVGLSHPTEGSIKIDNKSPDDPVLQKKLGFMPESPAFYQYLTGYEFLEFVASLFDIKDTDERIEKTLKEVDLLHAKDKRIRTYSKGMLQRLGLAQAIINNPDILFLDEPLDGLDPLGRAEIKKIILNLKSKGTTIFINTHILGDVEEICDTVSIIDKGEILVTGSPSVLSQGYKDLEDAFVTMIQNRRKERGDILIEGH